MKLVACCKYELEEKINKGWKDNVKINQLDAFKVIIEYGILK